MVYSIWKMMVNSALHKHVCYDRLQWRQTLLWLYFPYDVFIHYDESL